MDVSMIWTAASWAAAATPARRQRLTVQRTAALQKCAIQDMSVIYPLNVATLLASLRRVRRAVPHPQVASRAKRTTCVQSEHYWIDPEPTRQGLPSFENR